MYYPGNDVLFQLPFLSLKKSELNKTFIFTIKFVYDIV